MSKRESDRWYCARHIGTRAHDAGLVELQVCAECHVETWCFVDAESRRTGVGESIPSLKHDLEQASENDQAADNLADYPELEAETVEEVHILATDIGEEPLGVVADSDMAIDEIPPPTENATKTLEEQLAEAKAELAKYKGESE